MYMSYLLVDVGKNPDRLRPARTWLRNVYRVHQRLCMAFPGKERKENDPQFLRPYKSSDFGLKQVHEKRSQDTNFLFRIDYIPQGNAMIIVQSAIKPNWDYAFHNASYLLSAPPDCREFTIDFRKGERLRFRILANPTRRLSERSLGPDGLPLKRGAGKRVPVPSEQLMNWLERKAEHNGFKVEKCMLRPGYLYMNKKKNNENKVRFRSCLYDGILLVTDDSLFYKAIISGIGSGKAFGFGLLSVARI